MPIYTIIFFGISLRMLEGDMKLLNTKQFSKWSVTDELLDNQFDAEKELKVKLEKWPCTHERLKE